MPSEQYTLELTNTTVGRLDRRRSRVTGLVVGGTEIVLQDKSIHTLETRCIFIATADSGHEECVYETEGGRESVPVICINQ